MKRESPRQRKRRATRRQLARALERSLGEGVVYCVVGWPGVCRTWAEGWHHLRKLSQGGTDDPRNLVPCCNACNLRIEDDPLKARELGWVR